MNKLLELFVSLSFAGSLVVICLLLSRFISANMLSAKSRYMLGKMAVGFYLLPIALGIQWLSSLLTSKASAPISVASEWPSIVQHTLSERSSTFIPMQVIPKSLVSADVAFTLISLWSAGAITFAAWQIYCYSRFLKKLKHKQVPVPKHSEAAKQLILMKDALGIQSNVQLAYSSVIRSPILVGLWKPTIYLPLENASNIDLCMVIHHELIHLKRKDIWVKAVVLAASSLHWFNPFVHILRKEIHTWSELSCDAEVVKNMSHADRKRYGETILNVMAGARGIPVRFCASLSSDGKQLKRRLNMMLNVKKLKTSTIVLTTAALISVGVIGTTTAVWASSNTPKFETTLSEPETLSQRERTEGSAIDEASDHPSAVSERNEDGATDVSDIPIENVQPFTVSEIEGGAVDEEASPDIITPANVNFQETRTLSKGGSKTYSFDVNDGGFQTDHNAAGVVITLESGESYQYLSEDVTNGRTLMNKAYSGNANRTLSNLVPGNKYEITIINLGTSDLKYTISTTSYSQVE